MSTTTTRKPHAKKNTVSHSKTTTKSTNGHTAPTNYPTNWGNPGYGYPSGSNTPSNWVTPAYSNLVNPYFTDSVNRMIWSLRRMIWKRYWLFTFANGAGAGSLITS